MGVAFRFKDIMTGSAIRILCVCLGNICRSPLAEAVIRAKASAAGWEVSVDSAATETFHLGQRPDPRSIAAATLRGYQLRNGRARQVQPSDFFDFDLILAMDAENVASLRAAAPPASTAAIRLFHHTGLEITDPYHEPDAAFEAVLNMIEHAADNLVATKAGRA